MVFVLVVVSWSLGLMGIWEEVARLLAWPVVRVRMQVLECLVVVVLEFQVMARLWYLLGPV